MKTIVAVALVAAHATYYEAKVTTFGCNSIAEVSQLRSVQSDSKAFKTALFQERLYGQCVIVPTGMVVEGSVEDTDKSILRINARTDPPGFEAPLSDFKEQRSK